MKWIPIVLVPLLSVTIGAKGTDLASLTNLLNRAIVENDVVGVQLLVGHDRGIEFSASRGVLAPGSKRAVDHNTMFCIGSTSKPLAAMTLLRLADREQIQLNRPIDVWLPAFGQTRLPGGREIERAPNLAELLCHRGGIYSQKLRLNRAQARLLYDFDHTLQAAVDGIAGYPLIAPPGSLFAYSGAGYCVAGRIAEIVSDRSFDEVLRIELCQPLGMKRTTYFPDRLDDNVSTGALVEEGVKHPDPRQPHMSRPHHMQLVGGSLYSTAEDLAAFARAVIKLHRLGNGIISTARWQEAIQKRGGEPDYGLGWKIYRSGDSVVALAHSGHLASSQANLHIELNTGRFFILLGSLVDWIGERGNRSWRDLNIAAMGLVGR